MSEDIFIGREALRDALARVLEDPEGAAIVALAGEPGVGKSSLARVTASRWQAAAPRRVVVRVDAQHARVADELARAVDSAVVRAELAESAEAWITRTSREVTALLWLDDVDHVLDAARAIAQRWCASPDRALLTARAPLEGHARDHAVCQHHVEPMSEQDALALFRAHAGAAEASVEVGRDDTLAQLVHALDYHPLAIELAARRASLMSPEQLLGRMARRLDLLRMRRPDDPRQSSLRAMLDWSWETMTPTQREVWSQCAVFRGGFTLAELEVVLEVDGAPVDFVELLDTTEQLVARSLFRRIEPTSPRDPLRLSLPETSRLYAAEQLALTEAAERCAARHLAHFHERAQHWGRVLGGVSRPQDMRALDAELDNIIAAFRRALADGAPEVEGFSALFQHLLQTQASMTALTVTLRNASHHTLVLDPLEQARRLERDATQHARAGRLQEARASLEEAAGFVGEEAPELQARVLASLAGLHVQRGALDMAVELYERALWLERWRGDTARLLKLTRRLGRTALAHGDLERAHHHLDAARALARQRGEEEREAELCAQLTRLHMRRGDLTRAAEAADAGLLIARAGLPPRLLAELRLLRGRLAHEQGRFTEADHHYTHAANALATGQEVQTAGSIALDRAWLALDRGELEAADAASEALARVAERSGSRTLAAQVMLVDSMREIARGPAPHTRRRIDDALAIFHRRKNAQGCVLALALSVMCEVALEGSPEEARDSARLARVRLRDDASLWDEGVVEVAEALVVAFSGEGVREAEATAHRLQSALDAHARPDTPHPIGARQSRVFALTASLRAYLSELAIEQSGGADGEGTLSSEERAEALVVDEACKWFKLPDEPRVELGRKALLRRLFEALVHQRLDAPGEALAADALVEAGWPGELMTPEAAANRLYVSIKRLRGAGLDAWLRTEADGYLLDPSLPIVWGAREDVAHARDGGDEEE